MKLISASILILLMTINVANAQAPTYNELHLGTRLSFDPAIRTVKQAVEWVLRPTSYKLVIQHPAPFDALEIAKSPISPLATQQLGRVVSIEEALLLIIGGDNRLVVDPDNRLVSFESTPKLVKGEGAL